MGSNVTTFSEQEKQACVDGLTMTQQELASRWAAGCLEHPAQGPGRMLLERKSPASQVIVIRGLAPGK